MALYYPKVVDEAPAYIFGGLAAGHDLVFVPDFALQPRSFPRRVLKFLLVGRIPLGGRLTEFITGYRGYQWLTTLRSGDRLIVNGVTNLRTLQAIAWLTPKGVRRFQYFNNCLRFFIPPDEVAQRVERMKQMGYHLVSFDPQESTDYGMTYAPQFYRFPEPYDDVSVVPVLSVVSARIVASGSTSSSTPCRSKASPASSSWWARVGSPASTMRSTCTMCGRAAAWSTSSRRDRWG